MRAMTAYARTDKRRGSAFCEVVLRSLNSKYLEITIHGLPLERVYLEEAIKKAIREKIQRGRIEVYLFYRAPLKQHISVNENLLREYHAKLRRASRGLKIHNTLNINELIALPGVIELRERKCLDDNLVLQAIKEGISRLLSFKNKEGAAIKREIVKNFTRLYRNLTEIKKRRPRPKDENNKEDIEEEISLIAFYLSKLKEAIYAKKKTSKGKQMDFLSQEVLRELNTASAKTKNTKLSYLIVESKSYLERIREQIQNVE